MNGHDTQDALRATTREPRRALGRMVVGSILTSAALNFRDREAFLCAGTGRRVTFRQANERCNRLANGLTDAGLRKADVVAFLCNNRSELPEIYFALAKLGLVGIPLNYRLAPAEIIALVTEMDAKALIFATRFLWAAQQVKETVPNIAHLVAIGDDAPPWAQPYEQLLSSASADEPQVDVEEADPFYFNLTSGTTGLPKSYTLTHYNNATIGPMFASYDATSRDTFLTIFPAFGRVGYAWIAAGLMFGARNILMDFDAGEALRIIDTERVTLFNAVPTMGAMLLAEPSRPSRDLSSLRGIVFAGSTFPTQLRERIARELCPHIYEYYGMQESGALTVSTPAHRELHPSSVGVPIPFAELRIERSDGSLAAPDEPGEIVGRSPASVTQYFRNPEKSAETFRDGWVHTGDIGSMTEDGFLYVRGRLKDMIITGGQNVHAAEVEDAILSMEDVADCAVFALPDEFWGERVSAVIVRTSPSGATPSAEDVEQFCRQKLAGFKIPRVIYFDEGPLPRTPTGKVQKFLLVERFRTSR
ncbi:class I adenylate-forming enzyme family protein [Chelatococcus reniformis]|nr:AMP-binding protein [Chelatococcus reniformis]